MKRIILAALVGVLVSGSAWSALFKWSSINVSA